VIFACVLLWEVAACAGISGAELGESACMSEGEGHEVHGLEVAQTAVETRSFAEFCSSIRAAGIRHQQRGHGMPAMALQLRRSAVIAGNDEDVGAEGLDSGDDGVELLDHLDFGVEITVLATRIRVFEVNKEEVIVGFFPGFFQHVDFFIKSGRLPQQIHSDQTCQPLVHRIDGDGGGFQSVGFPIGRKVRPFRESAHGQPIGFGVLTDDFSRLGDELARDFGCLLAGFIVGLRVEWRHTDLLGIGVCHVGSQTRCPEYDDKTVFFHRFDEHFHTRDTDGLELLDQGGTLFAGDTACASIGDSTFAIQGAEIATDRHIVRADGETDPRRLQDAPADHVLEGIVPENSEMPRAASGSDSWLDGRHESADATAGQAVEVGGFGGFQLGGTARFEGEPSQPIRYHENDPTTFVLFKLRDDFLKVHVSYLMYSGLTTERATAHRTLSLLR